MPDPIHDLVSSIRRGEQTARAALQKCLDAIHQRDGELNCFRETYADDAMERAADIDARIKRSDPKVGPLAGVPIALKDNIVTEFGTTTCGSRMLKNYRSPYTATAAQRLIDAGAIIIGKTNCDEFAMGSSTEHCAFGATHNPWDVSRVPGGSSGGSAAAVAANMAPASLGSDTGGSIRQPASMCGVVGLKPTYGLVSRYGLVAYGSSLDQIGPFAHTVRDAALLMSVIAGPDVKDSTSARMAPRDLLGQIDEPMTNLRIGLPKQYRREENAPSVNAMLDDAVATFRSLGAEIVELDMPLTEYGIATYYVIATAEASSNLARYDGIRYGHRTTPIAGEDLSAFYARNRAEGFGPEVQRRIMLGTYVLSAGYYDAYYKRAMQARRLIKQEFDRAFAQCHAIIGPTSPFPAFPIGSRPDPLSMYLADVYTTNVNIAGICGISVPAGFDRSGAHPLPIGLQIQCQAFDEPTLLRVARTFERTRTP